MNLRRHLLIAAGILAAFVAGLMVRNWETTTAAFSNMTALSEGKEEAAYLRLPADLMTYLAHHPDDVSLVAFDLENEDQGIFLQPDTTRPTTGLFKLWTLATYAEQVTTGQTDSAARVATEAIAHYHLPGINEEGRAMQRFGSADSVTLAQVVAAMMQANDHTAADFLLLHLGDSTLHARVLPHSGLFLHWMDTSQAPLAQAQRLAEDPAFRADVREKLRAQGLGRTIREQRDLAHATFPQRTARAFADLFARAIADSLSPEVRYLRRHLEQPFPADTTGRRAFEAFSVHGGAFPGVISLGGYVRGSDGGRVVVLLMENVPLAVFYHLVQTGLDNGFVLQLLLDDAFFEEARTALQEARRS